MLQKPIETSIPISSNPLEILDIQNPNSLPNGRIIGHRNRIARQINLRVQIGNLVQEELVSRSRVDDEDDPV